MGRFNPKKWTPVQDSTPGLKTQDPRSVVLAWVEHVTEDGGILEGCPCGCESFPRNAKSKFVIGHDARFKGILIRAHLTGTSIRYFDIATQELVTPENPMHIARDLGWEQYLKDAAEKMEARKEKQAANAVGSRRLISVGRWEYTGRVVRAFTLDGVAHLVLEYTTKGGITKQIEMPAAQALPITSEGTK